MSSGRASTSTLGSPTGSDPDRSLDALFRSYTIAEVTRTLSKLKLENARLKSDLFALVGENYGKILEAADAVEAMKAFAGQIQELLESSLGQIQGAFSLEALACRPVAEKSNETCLVERIMDAPILAWELLQAGSAAKAFRHCQESLGLLQTGKQALPIPKHLQACLSAQLLDLEEKIKLFCRNSLFELRVKAFPMHEDYFLGTLKEALELQAEETASHNDLLELLLHLWNEQSWEIPLDYQQDDWIERLVAKNCQLLAFTTFLGEESPKLIEKAKKCFSKTLGSVTTSTPALSAKIDQALLRFLGSNSAQLSQVLQEVLETEADNQFELWFGPTLAEMQGRFRLEDSLRILFEFGKAFSAAYSEDCGANRSELLRNRLEILFFGSKLSSNSPSFLLIAPLFPEISELPTRRISDGVKSKYDFVPVAKTIR